MALVVEDGSGLANAESYVSVADCVTYAANRALTFSDTDMAAAEAAMRRATSAIDNRFRSRFVGYRTRRHSQALEWPRTGAYYYTPQAGDMPFGMLGGYGYGYGYGYGLYEYDQIDAGVIPVEIKNAVCEAAVRELAVPGALAPDLDRGNAIRTMKAGSVQIEYEAGAPRTTVFLAIDQALSGLLTPATPFSGTAARA
jgi:hypothetical protein